MRKTLALMAFTGQLSADAKNACADGVYYSVYADAKNVCADGVYVAKHLEPCMRTLEPTFERHTISFCRVT